MEDKENLPQSAEPEAKRAKLSLSLPKDRFSFSVDDRDLEEAMKKYSVKNTTLNNKWALKNFEDWFKAKRNTTQEPLNLLLTDDPAVLCDTLCVYIKETRKTDGTPYSPKTLYLLLAGLQRQIRLNKGRASSINIFSDPRLEKFHNVCDHEFRRLHQSGIGTETKHTEPLTKDDEQALWDKKVLDL